MESLNISVGILSPEFSKDKELYVVYLPFEVDMINIDATIEDTKYGVLKKEGPEKLVVGNNEYSLSVTAEDESVRTYKIIVVRAASVDSVNNSSNSNLKSLTLKNSKLIDKFDKNIYLYKYKAIDEDLIIDATVEDENSSLLISKVEDIYIITVTSASNAKSLYVLIPDSNSFNLFIPIFLVLLGVIGFIYFNKPKSNKKKK